MLFRSTGETFSMGSVWVISIGYQTRNRKTGVLNPKIKTVTKYFRNRDDCLKFEEHYRNLNRIFLWTSINQYEQDLRAYLDRIDQ